MEKFNFPYGFQTEGGVFHNCRKNQKKSQRKIFSNKDAKIDHFHNFPEMKHCSAVRDTFNALTPITVDYGDTKDVKVFTI